MRCGVQRPPATAPFAARRRYRESAMGFTLLYRVPRTQLKAIRRDPDLLDQFPCVDLAGVGREYWSLLATRLQLHAPVTEAPIALDEAGGVAVYEWSRSFADGFGRVDPD